MPNSPPNEHFLFRLYHPSEQEFLFAAKDHEHFEVWIEALTHACIPKAAKKGLPTQLEVPEPAEDEFVSI